MNASTNRLKIVKNGGLCLNSRLYVTVAASKMWHQWERSHTFSRYSVYVQRFCRFLKKSKFCGFRIARKKELFLQQYVEIREWKRHPGGRTLSPLLSNVFVIVLIVYSGDRLKPKGEHKSRIEGNLPFTKSQIVI